MWISNVNWSVKIRNEEVLRRIGEGRILLRTIENRNWIEHVLRRKCLLRDVFEGMVEGKRHRQRFVEGTLLIIIINK